MTPGLRLVHEKEALHKVPFFKLPFSGEILQLDPEDRLAWDSIEAALFLLLSPLTCIKGMHVPKYQLNEGLGTH